MQDIKGKRLLESQVYYLSFTVVMATTRIHTDLVYISKNLRAYYPDQTPIYEIKSQADRGILFRVNVIINDFGRVNNVISVVLLEPMPRFESQVDDRIIAHQADIRNKLRRFDVWTPVLEKMPYLMFKALQTVIN